MNNESGITIFGVPVDPLSMDDALKEVDDAVKSRRNLNIAFLNAGKLVAMENDSLLRESVLSADLRLADGQSVVWGCRFLGHKLPGRVAGVDLMMNMMKAGAGKGYRFFLFGARQEVIEKSVEEAKRKFGGINIAGFRNGYFSEAEEEGIADEIRDSGADILFVAMSSPKKEIFQKKYQERMGVPVIMGVGGSFDILAGKTKRAPMFLQRLGLEWFYRFLQEPGRMWKRYLAGNTLFILMVLRCRLGICNCCKR
ncbi:MAG: WecB/TagA/CpsF family glycosyltransferase [Nitrospinota bacterium]|nr:WecB/TagA/CpsF family glycosyltransferase [Nitrospinota bacterium]